jgi:hypothetical protein
MQPPTYLTNVCSWGIHPEDCNAIIIYLTKIEDTSFFFLSLALFNFRNFSLIATFLIKQEKSKRKRQQQNKANA